MKRIGECTCQVFAIPVQEESKLVRAGTNILQVLTKKSQLKLF